MRAIMTLVIYAAIALMLFGCEFKKNISREEIPLIKKSLGAFEVVLKLRSTVYVDSLLSSDAAEAGTSSKYILDFVYSDGMEEFAGFTKKQIFFRGDAARVDCTISGPDGPVKDVTITMRKEDETWLVKKIETRIDDGIEGDSLGT
jgi:hypothetical protein